jgi:hypothetical protein
LLRAAIVLKEIEAGMPGFLPKSPSSMSHRRQSFCFILSLPLLLSKSLHHARESVGREKSSQLSVPLTTPRLRTLHCAEDPGSSRKEA